MLPDSRTFIWFARAFDFKISPDYGACRIWAPSIKLLYQTKKIQLEKLNVEEGMNLKEEPSHQVGK